MAELNDNAPDIDSMSDDQVAEIAGKMSRGEDLSAEPEKVETEVETDSDDTEAEVETVEADGKAKPETVPHGRFEHERQRRKEAETARADLEARYRTLEERSNGILKMLEQRDAPKAEEPAARPELLADPLFHVEDNGKRLEELEKRLAGRDEADKQREQRLAFANHVNGLETQFANKTPDYNEARTYAYQHRLEELSMMYPAMSEQQRAQHVLAEWNAAVQMHVQKGTNPAEGLYNLAKKWGFQKPEPAVDPQAEIDKIAEVDRIKKSAGSLTPAGGSISRTGAVTPGDIANMTDKQYDEWRAKHDLREAFAA